MNININKRELEDGSTIFSCGIFSIAESRTGTALFLDGKAGCMFLDEIFSSEEYIASILMQLLRSQTDDDIYKYFNDFHKMKTEDFLDSVYERVVKTDAAGGCER